MSTGIASVRRLTGLLGFTCGAIATIAVMWLIPDVSAQTISSPTLHVCVDDQRVMRMIGPLEACPPGHKSMYLNPAPDGKAEPEKPESKPAVDEQKLAELERRVALLGECAAAGDLGNKVVAPFEVLDRAGKRVFYVEEQQTTLYNTNGKALARIVANQNGGYFLGYSATASLGVSLGAADDKVGVIIEDNNVNRLELGRSSQGTYHLKFVGKSGKEVAGIGQTPPGPGIAFVADEAGNVKARLMVHEQNGNGRVEILNKANQSVALLTEEGKSGGGYMVLYGTDGRPMVDAGVTPDGVGVVRAGPSGFPVGVSLVGLPGSFIVGRK